MSTTLHRWADLPATQDRVAAREQAATHVRVFCPGLVPGLLQTPACTRWLCERLGCEGDVDRLVEGRRLRQKLLGQPGRRFELLVPMSALSQQASAASMLPASEQVRQVYVLDRLPGVEVRVHSSATPFLHGFTLYGDSMVEIELEHGELLLTGAEDVALYRRRWETLWAGAVAWEKGAGT